jgi:hypothetical protein
MRSFAKVDSSDKNKDFRWVHAAATDPFGLATTGGWLMISIATP